MGSTGSLSAKVRCSIPVVSIRPRFRVRPLRKQCQDRGRCRVGASAAGTVKFTITVMKAIHDTCPEKTIVVSSPDAADYFLRLDTDGIFIIRAKMVAFSRIGEMSFVGEKFSINKDVNLFCKLSVRWRPSSKPDGIQSWLRDEATANCREGKTSISFEAGTSTHCGRISGTGRIGSGAGTFCTESTPIRFSSGASSFAKAGSM